jgi:DNA-binding MarR family transcriptional regulator
MTIRDLISYRLSRTASLMSRGAALRYKREFDVNLGEWRALALLASGRPQSLIQLSRAAGLDKAQMSRVVTSLIGRGLVLRALSPNGGRAVELSLTAAGRRTYTGLIAAAAERDEAFRAALSPEELAVLEAGLDKLAETARRFIRAEAAPAADDN